MPAPRPTPRGPGAPPGRWRGVKEGETDRLLGCWREGGEARREREWAASRERQSARARGPPPAPGMESSLYLLLGCARGRPGST